MTKKHVVESSDPSTIRLTLEKEIQSNPDYWKKVHDSSKVSDGDTRKVFTRVYAFYLFGQPTNIGIKFVYDYRQGGKSTATFDAVVIKVLKHMIEGNYNEKIIGEYLRKQREVKECGKNAFQNNI